MASHKVTTCCTGLPMALARKGKCRLKSLVIFVWVGPGRGPGSAKKKKKKKNKRRSWETVSRAQLLHL